MFFLIATRYNFTPRMYYCINFININRVKCGKPNKLNPFEWVLFSVHSKVFQNSNLNLSGRNIYLWNNSYNIENHFLRLRITEYNWKFPTTITPSGKCSLYYFFYWTHRNVVIKIISYVLINKRIPIQKITKINMNSFFPLLDFSGNLKK